MTIDEAIEHAKDVARTCDDGQCAADHMQLAEWLRRARGADKAARWYTEKIRELETLIGEKEAENAELCELVCELYEDQCDECDQWKYCDRMRELGIEEKS